MVGMLIKINFTFKKFNFNWHNVCLFLFVLLLYVPSQQLWSWRDGQFT